jgi:hypothetical protein
MGMTVMTGKKWIIDVLADLKAFAEQNDLPLLAAQLGETALLAMVEIAQVPDKVEGTPLAVLGDSAGTRNISGAGGTC